ncbi:helix-hairpin-helix domain-containing protein [Sphingobacterium sp. lm-10]|uniref:ComEA family DNA-binding protein n=1 Tax=Sphingobacterium sp. lm-10 TaxID=2944904 RepID=UPI002021C52E|nr:helix-hairpin-helix domain-containing protein [Sphingobacterium sp. lm-10]MCL7987985.1 helix-hairpin-helix domain-containing protein [Sphingobacterium sp. lm-10]
MYSRRITLWALFIILLPITTQAQVLEEAFMEEQLLELLVEDLAPDLDVSEILERLRQYLIHPLDLNRATEQDFAALVFLSPLQINNLLNHRKQSGHYLSVLELQAVEGFDIQAVRLLQRFVRVGVQSDGKRLSVRDVVQKSRYEVMVRYGRILESQQGYQITDESRSRYLGSPDRVATRIRINYDNRLEIAVNMNKQAGEPFFRYAQRYGFDFYSGSILLKDVGIFKRIIVGDYALQLGQGLILWNGLQFGKGAWIGSVARQGVGLLQYKSLNESNFMRGTSAVIAHRNWYVIPFVAWNKLSGNVMEVDDQREIRTINYSGNHRTPTEQNYRRAINQYVYGVSTYYQRDRFKLGATWLSTTFDGYIRPNNELRNLFSFEGRQLNNMGIFYNYTYRNTYLYGEVAQSVGSGYATNNGLMASLHPKLTVLINHRYYAADYYHFFAQSIGEQSGLGNERGLYTGLMYHPSRKIEWVNYLDAFSFPWLRFRADAPSSGMDFLSQFSYIWYRKGRLIFRFRHRLRPENFTDPARSENLQADMIRNQGRVDFQYKLNENWSIRSRAELSYYFKELTSREFGVLLFQDVLWSSRSSKISGNTRIAYFSTESYDSRIYAYEQDVLYAASFPLYYGIGWRSYANVRWQLSRKVDLWARYAITKLPGVESIGSQLDRIDGDKRSEMRLQIRFRW